MAKLIPAKLTLEDFKEQRSWIGPMFSILNAFTGDVVRAFSNQLTIADNLYQEIKEIKFTNIAGDFPLRFRTKFSTSPKGLHCIYLFNETDATYSTAAPWVVWSYSDGSIVISDISGLTASNIYTIRLLVFYE